MQTVTLIHCFYSPFGWQFSLNVFIWSRFSTEAYSWALCASLCSILTTNRLDTLIAILHAKKSDKFPSFFLFKFSSTRDF